MTPLQTGKVRTVTRADDASRRPHMASHLALARQQVTSDESSTLSQPNAKLAELY